MPGSRGSVFLWGMGPPVPDPGTFQPRSIAWWTQYVSSLKFGPAGLAELARSSRGIVALLPDPKNWGSHPKLFKGLVVGAIQSGKTASMIGVAAAAVDQGYRIIVVLAGGKDDLRRQTARRFNTQLLQQSDRIPDTQNATTLGRPPGRGPLGGFAPPYAFDTNQFAQLQLRAEDSLKRGEPCIIVVKKNVTSLEVLRGALQYVYSTFGVASLPTVVMDDECDDSSVDVVGAPIPIAIENLWRREGDPPLVTYIGYTATAAANILQHPENELYPTHFVSLLRSPGEEETEVQYAESTPDAWYTGGDCYYSTFGDEAGDTANFLVASSVEQPHLVGPVEANPSLQEAVRAYFVAGAFRLALESDRSFEAGKIPPRPHSMLVQTSASTSDHMVWVKGIQKILGGVLRDDKTIQPDADFVLGSVAQEEGKWRRWYESFEMSRERVYLERPHPGVQRVVTWEQVKGCLRAAIENTRLKVVNSDAGVASNLDYAPRLTVAGAAMAPQDVYVIVVGGSKLSRGITLEGLCISYFTRWVPNPTEDTVQQMSRWLGYRGPHLEFCRLFTSQPVYECLRQMSENDADLRYQLAELMKVGKSLKESILVLRANPRALPTGKMGDTTIDDLAFSPYTAFLPVVEVGAFAEANQVAALDLIALVREGQAHEVTSISGAKRGILSRGWVAEEIADILDAIKFSQHNPDNTANPMSEYYRKVEDDRAVVESIPVVSDPYQVAAYLRAWARGEHPRSQEPPLFNVGIVYGELSQSCKPFDFDLVNREIRAGGRVIGGWTGRSANWQGDAYFDSPPMQFRQGGSLQRLQGSDGLLLLYVIHKDAVGRAGRGMKRQFHTPAYAVSIPSGGPLFRRVVVDHRPSRSGRT